MSRLALDFETRSTCDLKVCGAYNYAQDPTTEIICLGWAVDDRPAQVWMAGTPLPPMLMSYLVNRGVTKVAHNASFEQLIFEHVWEGPQVEGLWSDTMIRAQACGYPAGLDKLSVVLDLEHKKDRAGHMEMLRVCKPRRIEEDGTIVWWDEPERIQRVADYCLRDIDAERELDGLFPELSIQEQANLALSEAINDRGVMVDLYYVLQAQKVAKGWKNACSRRIAQVSRGAVKSVTDVMGLLRYLNEHGLVLTSVDKAALAEALKGDLPPDVRKVIRLRLSGAKTSTSKLTAMQRRTSEDGRLRGMFMFHRATTGRWGSMGVQLHNLPRGGKEKELEWLREAVLSGDHEMAYMVAGDAMTAITNTLRTCFVAPEGKRLVVWDFNAIEGRITAFLAGETWKIGAYARGEDLYVVAAEKIGPGTDRQIGKVAELALGFAGGKGAFLSMGKIYGLVMSEDEAEGIKVAWREAHPMIVKLWYGLQRAAMQALQAPGKAFPYRQLAYRLVDGDLRCRLPSGRVLNYPRARIEEVETPWGEMRAAVTFETEDSMTGQWVRKVGTPGLLTENVVQAVAADVMRELIRKANVERLDVVMHVHDEIVIESARPAHDLELIDKLGSEVPEWLKGCPIAGKGFISDYYRKD